MRAPTMKKRIVLALLLVLAGIAIGSCMRGFAMLWREQMAHDEAVTYLAATGHLGAYDRAEHGGLSGRWVEAAQWKQLTQPGGFWVFGTIAGDLAHFDNHPPLYFWLLHVWLALFGWNLNSGVMLNIGVAIVTGFLLFGFAWYVRGDPLEAALVATVWSLAAPSIATSLMARQYDLLAFFTVVFVWLVVSMTASRGRLRWWNVALLALATAGGMLTHYHFALVLLGGGVFAAARLWRTDRRRLLWLVVTAGVGVGLFIAAHPLFYLSIGHQAGQASKPTWSGLAERLGAVAAGLGGFFGAADAPWWLGGFGAAAAAAAAGVWLRRRRLTAGSAPPAPGPGPPRYPLEGRSAAALFFLLWVGGATVLLYLAFRSPVFAMHDRYLAAVWPFMAFVPLMLASVLGRWRIAVVAVFCLLVLVPAGIDRVRTYQPRSPNPVPSIRKAHHLVLNGLTRGNLPRVIWLVPDDKLVFADTQAGIASTVEQWLPRLVVKDIYVSGAGDAADAAVKRQVLEHLRTRFELRRPGSVWGLFELWRLYEKPTDAAP